MLFLNISSANVTALNPRVFSTKKKISKGLSISPAQAVLQNVTEGCSPSLTTHCLDLVESSWSLLVLFPVSVIFS